MIYYVSSVCWKKPYVTVKSHDFRRSAGYKSSEAHYSLPQLVLAQVSHAHDERLMREKQLLTAIKNLNEERESEKVNQSHAEPKAGDRFQLTDC